jgi:NADPH-dependent glutamate synthase beta subunit-like oxidoreductase
MLEEGIEVQFLTAPVKIHYSGNSISKVECVRMELGEADASGRRRPIPIEGSNFYLDAEQIFTAIGETSDLTFIEEQIKIEKWGIPTDEFGRTENPKIFAGGDVATGEGTVTHAIGSGRKTALAIKSFLEGGDLTTEDLLPPALKNVDPHIVTFENLNLDYFDQREAVINKVLGVSEALYEAQRCFSCGTCPGCDNCFVFCPDTAISHASEPNGRYLIDIKHCKGCGLCYAECPRFCIEFNLLR